jgi:hypothetical protein
MLLRVEKMELIMIRSNPVIRIRFVLRFKHTRRAISSFLKVNKTANERKF